MSGYGYGLRLTSCMLRTKAKSIIAAKSSILFRSPVFTGLVLLFGTVVFFSVFGVGVGVDFPRTAFGSSVTL